MIIAPHQAGHLAITQQAHAEMCAQLGRAWGNVAFPLPDDSSVLLIAAEGHELGMLELDQHPPLSSTPGLPASVRELEPAEHLPLQRLSADRLAERDQRAALICSLHHTSFYERPSPAALIVRKHRLVREYLNGEERRQRELRRRLEPDESSLQLEWRLLRCWDGLSHVLVHDRAPILLPNVPDRSGGLTEISIVSNNGSVTLDPWPFSGDRLVTTVRGRTLEGGYGTREEMQSALEQARELEFRYELRPR